MFQHGFLCLIFCRRDMTAPAPLLKCLSSEWEEFISFSEKYNDVTEEVACSMFTR